MDQVLLTDTNGTMAWLQFEAMGFDRVKAPTVVTYADHQVYQFDARNTDDHRYLQTASRRFGGYYSKPGNGICHQVHLETFGAPGLTLLGSTATRPSAARSACWRSGPAVSTSPAPWAASPYYFPMPRVVQVVLTGRLRPWVAAKDVILELLRRLTVRGGFGKIFEYAGPGVATLTVPQRATIANMGAELGLTTSVFPSDDVTRDLPRRGSGATRPGGRLPRIPGAVLRRHARDRPLGDRASRRPARLAGSRRPGRRGRGHVDRAGPGRVLHERLVGGHVRRRRGPARAPRPRRRVVRPLPREPAGPRDDGAPGAGRRPARGGRGRLGIHLRRVPRHRPRAGRRAHGASGPSTATSRGGAASRATRSTSRPRRPPASRRSAA